MGVRTHKFKGTGNGGQVQLSTVLTWKVLGDARMSYGPWDQPHLSIPLSNLFSPLSNLSGAAGAFPYAQL